MSAEKYSVQRSTNNQTLKLLAYNVIRSRWRIVAYHDSTVTSRILLVQSILPNYKTSDTPPPDPPLQRRRARKSTCADPIYFFSTYADPIYFFSALDVVKHLHGKGRKYSTGTELALIKFYTVLALIKIYTVPVG